MMKTKEQIRKEISGKDSFKIRVINKSIENATLSFGDSNQITKSIEKSLTRVWAKSVEAGIRFGNKDAPVGGSLNTVVTHTNSHEIKEVATTLKGSYDKVDYTVEDGQLAVRWTDIKVVRVGYGIGFFDLEVIDCNSRKIAKKGDWDTFFDGEFLYLDDDETDLPRIRDRLLRGNDGKPKYDNELIKASTILPDEIGKIAVTLKEVNTRFEIKFGQLTHRFNGAPTTMFAISLSVVSPYPELETWSTSYIDPDALNRKKWYAAVRKTAYFGDLWPENQNRQVTNKWLMKSIGKLQFNAENREQAMEIVCFRRDMGFKLQMYVSGADIVKMQRCLTTEPSVRCTYG